MAVVIPGHLVMLEHRRTGSTAVREALLTLPNAVAYGRHYENPPHDDEVVAAIVRNPFDCLVTWWMRLGDHPRKSFEAFLRECCGYPSPFMRDGSLFYFSRRLEFVVRYEHLQDDVNNLLTHTGLPHVQLERVNVTRQKGNYRDYYTAALVRLVEKQFSKDLHQFGYSWDGAG